MPQKDRLEVTYRHGRSGDVTVMRVIVEGVDVGAIRRVTDSEGGWRPERPDLSRAPARRPDRDGAASDVLKHTRGLSADLVDRAVTGRLTERQHEDLLVELGVARRR